MLPAAEGTGPGPFDDFEDLEDFFGGGGGGFLKVSLQVYWPVLCFV